MDSYQKTTKKIKSVLDGKFESVDLSDIASPSTAISIIENDFKIEKSSEFTTNGWQWDFWQYYSRGEEGSESEEKFCLCGSGYYGELEFKVSKDNK